MITPFNLPKYNKVIYQLNPETKYYLKTAIERQETPINRLPDELRIAPTGAAQIKENADQMLLSRLTDGKYNFRTGIQPTSYINWFLGNDFEFSRGQKVISIIIFHFTNNNSQLEVYHFHRYDKRNNFYRMVFANGIIPHLQNGSLN